MKILFVSPVGVIGGAERILIESARQTRRLRPEWRLAAIIFADGPLNKALSDLGVSVEVVALPGAMAAAGDSKRIQPTKPNSNTQQLATTNGLSQLLNRVYRVLKRGAGLVGLMPSAVIFFWQLRRSISKNRPELIHSNGLKSHLCLAIAKPRGIAMLWHIHDFYSHRPRIARWVRLARKRTSGCIVISKAVENDTRKELPGIQLHLLLNCVDTDHFCPGPADPEALDRAAGFPVNNSSSDIIRVGLVATYARWKGQDVFLQAISQVPNVRAYIVGGPIYSTQGSQWKESELQELAVALAIDDRVGFIPFQSDPRWIYRSLDIVVHASARPEPFGLTIVEAMACAKPVVVSATGGASELFENGKSGLGFACGSSQELADRISSLVVDKDNWPRIGSAAMTKVSREFSSPEFGLELMRIYDSVFSRLVTK